jgi:FlaA1/EpsC-like NDP-sugar epimerase
MKNIIIIGAGTAGLMVAREIQNHKLFRNTCNIVGFTDDDPASAKGSSIPLLGPISETGALIASYQVNEVIIAIPSAGRDTIQQILHSLANISVQIKIVPGIYEIINGSVHLQQIRDISPVDLLGREEISFDHERIAPWYKNRRILITGGGGSIGSEIVRQILKLPVERVVAMGHGENSIHNLITNMDPDPRFDYIIGDIKDHHKLRREMKHFEIDTVFHAAAHKHVPLMQRYPDEAVKNNIIGTYKCAVTAAECGVKDFILVSTDKAVNPTSTMGSTKRIAERIIQSLNSNHEKTRFSLTRFGNVLASRGSVIPLFMRQIRSGGPITVTHPDVTRYFMSITEAARLVIKSATVQDGSVFVLDMGQQVKILELARNLVRLCGFLEDEIPIVFTGLRQGEKLYEEILLDRDCIIDSPFEKLFISREDAEILNPGELLEMVSAFSNAADSCDNNLIHSLIKEYVPEYQRENRSE